MEIIGNEITVTASVTFAGPDGVELVRNPGAVWSRVRIEGNWITHGANCKQGVLLAGNTPAAGKERVEITNNWFFGIDVTDVPDLMGDNSGQVALGVDSVGARVIGNYFDRWRSWANVKGAANAPGVFVGNLCITDAAQWNAGTSPMAGSGPSGSDYVIVANNTFITQKDMTAPSSVPLYRVTGTNNVIRNNVFSGPWSTAFRMYGGAAQTEDYNVYFGLRSTPVVGAASGSSLSLGFHDTTVDPMLDVYGRPLPGSPLIGAAEPIIDWNGSLLIYEDIFGCIAGDPKKCSRGAVQVIPD
jgi:hypothetical protein